MGSSLWPLSSSFLWFIFRTLERNPKKELLRGLWVGLIAGPFLEQSRAFGVKGLAYGAE